VIAVVGDGSDGFGIEVKLFAELDDGERVPARGRQGASFGSFTEPDWSPSREQVEESVRNMLGSPLAFAGLGKALAERGASVGEEALRAAPFEVEFDGPG
jgi:hypothetical protein